MQCLARAMNSAAKFQWNRKWTPNSCRMSCVAVCPTLWQRATTRHNNDGRKIECTHAHRTPMKCTMESSKNIVMHPLKLSFQWFYFYFISRIASRFWLLLCPCSMCISMGMQSYVMYADSFSHFDWTSVDCISSERREVMSFGVPPAPTNSIGSTSALLCIPLLFLLLSLFSSPSFDPALPGAFFPYFHQSANRRDRTIVAAVCGFFFPMIFFSSWFRTKTAFIH